MSQTVTVRTLKPLRYRDRAYRVGQRVAMRPIDAAAAARRGEVSLDPTVNSQPDRRRTYRRRDLVAEP